MPIVPGFVSDTVVPAKSSTVSLFVRARRTRSSYAAWNAAKSSVSAFFTFGTSSVRLPSDFCWSIASPRFTCVMAHDARRAVDDAEARVHRRHLLQRAHDRETDEVREADLAAAIARELVVQDLAVDLEQLGGQRAHRRCGRDAEARFHVLDDARRRAPQRLRRLAVERDRAGASRRLWRVGGGGRRRGNGGRGRDRSGRRRHAVGSRRRTRASPRRPRSGSRGTGGTSRRSARHWGRAPRGEARQASRRSSS